MINASTIRGWVRDHGAHGAAHLVHQHLGLEDPQTQAPYHTRRFGQVVLESESDRAARVSDLATLAPTASNWSIKEMAKGFLGCDGTELDSALRQSARAAHEVGNVMEAGAAIPPSQFANISAYNAGTAGLFEARMLEAYSRPEFVLSNVVETITEQRRQALLLGISMVGDTAEERKPGDPHHRIVLQERYVKGPITINRGNGVDVTREAVLFDLTRELLSQAETAVQTLALRKEYLITDVVIGVENSYNYRDTTYNTYATSGNWINKLASNALVDWSQFNAANQLFTTMTDQETGQPIQIEVKQVFVMPYKEMSSRYVFNFTGLENTSSDLTRRGFAPNNLGGGRYEFLPPSKYAYRRATDADGLNLAASVAQAYWWLGDFNRAFAWVQNIPLTIERATPTDYTMSDRGLMFSLFCDEMGAAMVKDPRFVVLSTG
jgi:hypothetical protein